MQPMSRRSFMKQAAAVAGAAAVPLVLPGGGGNLLFGAEPGYFEKEFGVTESLCRKALAKALSRGGDFADLYFEHTLGNFLSLEDGQVNSAFGRVSLGVGIRTVKGDQVGYGFTQALTPEAILKAAETAATIADAGPRKVADRFAPLKTAEYYPLQKLLTAIPVESKLPLVQGVNDQCFKKSPLVVKATVMFHDEQKRILIVSSDGVKAEDLQPRNFLVGSVVAEKNGRREMGSWDLGGRRDFSYYTPAVVEEVARRAVDKALLMFEATQPPAGEMPVVLGPGVTAILLHEALGHGMEADFNYRKQSTYCTMIGRKVAEPFVTILDDATLPHQLGSINVDDEGTPGQKTVLIDRGILVSYMHDKISAAQYKVKPTGNGRRQSYQHYVQPRMRNTYMLAGPATREDVLRGVKKGIFVEDVSNGEVRIGEGDFSFYVSQGKMIEDGKLTAPIKDVNIMGNGPKMLQNIALVADDLTFCQGGGGACGKGGQSVPVGFGQPTCLVKSMTVGGVKA